LFTSTYVTHIYFIPDIIKRHTGVVAVTHRCNFWPVSQQLFVIYISTIHISSASCQ